MSELPSLAGLSLGAPTGPPAGGAGGAVGADGRFRQHEHFTRELRQQFMDLVTRAMEVDAEWWGEEARRIKAQKPKYSNGSPYPYPRFDRAMAGYYDDSTEEGRLWVDRSVLRFWQHYLYPILIGQQDVGFRMHRSADKMETMHTLVNEWIPALKGYIADRERDIAERDATPPMPPGSESACAVQ